MKLNPAFELLIITLVLMPFLYLFQHWNPTLYIQNQSVFLLYCVAVIVFYFLPFLFQKIDSKKENAEVLLRNGRKIRLIWTAYLSVLGFILFYYTVNDIQEERTRFLGVALSLFLFASGNFQHNLHYSSAFAGNSWVAKTMGEAEYKASQRFNSRLFFWVGIAGTLFFLSNQSQTLNFWGLIFLGLIIFYGIVYRLIKGLVGSKHS